MRHAYLFRWLMRSGIVSGAVIKCSVKISDEEEESDDDDEDAN